MKRFIGLELYSVRDATGKDFEGAVRKVAAMGYDGVEPAGFPRTTPEKAGKLFKELGFLVPSIHIDLPIGEKKNKTLDTMAAIDCKYAICASLPSSNFASLDGVKKAAETLNEANEVAKANGVRIGYHNHSHEFQIVGGRFAYDILREFTAPEVLFQVDTYWVTTAGVDVIKLVKDLGKRAPNLHIKDGPCVKNQPMVAVGEGKMDVPGILEATKDTSDWLVVELDACATDMFVAVDKSYKYLAGLVK